jgi:glycogen operon protein
VRAQQQRNLLATLILSQGVPMLLAGDEFGQTQGGNNNAYCQDTPVAWLDWNWSEEQHALFDFTRSVIKLRETQPVFQRRHFLQGRAIYGPEIKDVYWIKPDGTEMSDADWNSGHARTLCMVLPGDQITQTDEHGQRIIGKTFALLLNAGSELIPFRLGAREHDLRWHCVFDTAAPNEESRVFAEMEILPLQPRSFALLQAEPRSA